MANDEESTEGVERDEEVEAERDGVKEERPSEAKGRVVEGGGEVAKEAPGEDGGEGGHDLQVVLKGGQSLDIEK